MARRTSLVERRERHAAVDDADAVFNAALRFLEARPRSVAEVRRRLRTAGYQPDLIERAVERLLDLRVLDDEGFARMWVESRDRAHPRGEIALRRELALKGVGRDIVDAVLADRRVESEPEADDERARRLLERHARTLERETDPRRRRARTYALLARNGFDPELAARLAREIGSDREDAREDASPDR